MPDDDQPTAVQPTTEQPSENPGEGAAAPPEPEVQAANDGETGAWTALAAPGKPDGEVDTRP